MILTDLYCTRTQQLESITRIPAKVLVLIWTMLIIMCQGVSYAHDVNPPDHNHTPRFVEDGETAKFKNVYVSENTPNFLIGNVSAIDADEDDTLTYSLTADFNYYSLYPGHRLSYNEFYTINSETGELHVGSGGLDYEKFPFTYHPTHKYQPVWIIVEDGTGLGIEDVNRGFSRYAYNVYIKDENDNAPVFLEDTQSLSINENELSETTVGTVSATDADEIAGDHTYTIETKNVPFTIESSKRSGTIKTTSMLDYETTNSYTITVKVNDGFGTDTISVTISVINDSSDDTTNNTAPMFSEGESTSRSVVENTPAGRDIGTPISATDADSGDSLEYTLSGTDAAAFSINSTTGQLQTNATLDYETKNAYAVIVSVSDGNGGTDSISVTISVTNDISDDTTNNTAPTFTDGGSTSRSVLENTPSGRDIGTPISATDADSGDSLEYTLSGTDAAAFSINTSTGQLQTNATLDYETKNAYVVIVNVSDGNGGTDSITVNITIHKIGQEDGVRQPNYTIIPFDYETEGVGNVVFSELMLARSERFPQWIELYNTTDQDIDLNGWKIVGRYLDDSDTITLLDSHVISKSLIVKSKEVVLIVSFAAANTNKNISIGLADKTYVLNSNPKNYWNHKGLVLELQDVEGNPIDRCGNLNTEDKIVWEIPQSVRNNRISMIRRLRSISSNEYKFEFGVKEFGWFPAIEVTRLAENRNEYFYGSDTDIGTPGYRRKENEILPVTLTTFSAELNRNGQIILSWITESEIDNAGFNILRSQSEQGTFVKVNPKLIQGAGTTGKRSSYKWTDTSAQPDVVYYYRIEDVSFAGLRSPLATARTRGHVSPSERYITQWGNLKKQY